ncbi:hypothetical protein [Streptomyces sp. N35]|uniref:hypothetical protein n=1 Tax=Streptomyces sp. N35 TaxID=2795730 RepID=UPI0018F67C1C|nr:hypothetical protein [Streptomyces sp. N35]
MDTIKALHIDVDTTVTPLTLRTPPYDQLRTLLGGVTVTGIYHRRAVLHILDDGQQRHADGRTGLNLAAWALASAWRGIDLYPLYGPVVITGGDAGTSTSLEDDLGTQVLRSATTVRETLAEWRLRPPASNDAAVAELLAYVRNDLRAVHD